MSEIPLADLLLRIHEQARRDARDAITLPPPCYWREDFWRLEVERIFRRDWLCVGRSEQVRNSGDWLTADLVGEPIVVVRDEGGQLRALSRVCRHRSMDMLHDSASRLGHAKLLTCPYHLWSYALDGRLKASPMMQASRVHEPSTCALPQFAIDEWQGFIFVSLDADPPALAPRMASLDALLTGVDMSRWRVAGSIAWGEAAVNWKLALENFVEFYHHIGTHQNSLQQLWPASLVRLEARGDDRCTAGRMAVNPELAESLEDGVPIQATQLPALPGLSTEQRGGTTVMAVFPLFAIALSPDSAIWFEWYPTGPESHVLDIHLLVPAESFEVRGFDAIVRGQLDAIRQVQTEDASANAAVQSGLKSWVAQQGPLAGLENPIWQFQRYLARMLCN